jgi:hypothetical protein
MGYDVFAITLLLVSIVLAIVIVIVRYRLRQREEVDASQVWETYARDRKFTFVPGEGEWPNRSVPRIVSADGDLQIVLVRVGEQILTRMELRPRESLLGRLHVTTEAPVPNVPRVELTQELLDPALVVHAKPAQLATSVLTKDVARALSAFRMGGHLSFEYERGRIVLEWKGGEENPARLDEAIRLVKLVDEAMSAAFRHA